MPRQAIQPSLRIAQLLRRKREELGLSLRDISDRSRALGDPIPASTLARIEQGKTDPGVRRVHQLLRLYRVAPQFAADLVELEDLAVERPRHKDLQRLYDDGVRHWSNGEVDKALAHLFAVREFVPADAKMRKLRHRATFVFAGAASKLGRYRLARQIIEDLLCEEPDPDLLLNLFLLQSTIWTALGSLPVALAFVRQAEWLIAKDDRRQESWVYHQKAKLLIETGNPQEAEQALDRALDSYRAVNDHYGEGLGLLLRISIQVAAGDVPRAVAQAREVVAMAEKNNHARLALLGRIELGRLLVATGSETEGRESLEVALGQSVMIKDRAAEFLAHYHLWKTNEAHGDQDRARVELDACCYFVKFVDDVSAETIEIRALMERRRGEGREHGKQGKRRARYRLGNGT